MTIEQFFQSAFGEFWLFTTLVFPEITFWYAGVTKQVGWMLGSMILSIIYHLVGYSKSKDNNN